MRPDESTDLHYRDGNFPNPFLGLIALAPGCYLTFLLFARGIPKMIQAPLPQGNEWWSVLVMLFIFTSCWLAFVGGGLLLMFLKRGATFSTSPPVVKIWNRWLWWERVHRHSLNGYDAIQVRWCRAGKHNSAYYYLAVLGQQQPDIPIDTVFDSRFHMAEAMANEIADRMGWKVAEMPAESTPPRSNRCKA